MRCATLRALSTYAHLRASGIKSSLVPARRMEAPLTPACAGVSGILFAVMQWVVDPRFRLRALRFGGRGPAEARNASIGWGAGVSGVFVSCSVVLRTAVSGHDGGRSGGRSLYPLNAA